MTAPAVPVVPLEDDGRSRPLLAVVAFRRLWLAGWLSATGHQIARIGIILHLAGGREGVAAVALFVALDTLPGAAVAPFAGPLIDRWRKPATMIGADVARIGLALAILASPTPLVIYVAAALHSVASAFFHPAKSAAIPLAVRERQIPAANSADQSAGNLVFVVAPILAAELFLRLGLTGVLAVHAVLHLASAGVLRGLRLAGEPAAAAPASGAGTAAAATGEAAGGDEAPSWRPLFADRGIRLLLVLTFVSLFCTGLWLPIAPRFLADVLGAGERSFAWQIGLTGLGAVLGALWAPRWIARFGTGRVLLAAFVLEGLTLTVYSLLPWLAGSMLLMLVWGLAVSMIAVPFHSLLQTAVRRRLLGRMFTVVQQTENLALLLAVCAAFLVEGRVAAQSAFLGVGVLYVSIALLAARTPTGRTLWASR